MGFRAQYYFVLNKRTERELSQCHIAQRLLVRKRSIRKQSFKLLWWSLHQTLSCSDEESPLWEISARDLTSKMQFEVVLTMEGITPETGNTIQVNCKIFQTIWSQIFYILCKLNFWQHTIFAQNLIKPIKSFGLERIIQYYTYYNILITPCFCCGCPWNSSGRVDVDI